MTWVVVKLIQPTWPGMPLNSSKSFVVALFELHTGLSNSLSAMIISTDRDKLEPPWALPRFYRDGVPLITPLRVFESAPRKSQIRFNDLIFKNNIPVAEKVSATDDNPGLTMTPSLSLSEYLSREMVINNIAWTEGGSLDLTCMDPWQLMLAIGPLKNKLQNYAWIKADMKIKIMISSNPFLYSGVHVAYIPLEKSDTVSLAEPISYGHPTYAATKGTFTSLLHITQRSSSPWSGWLHPQDGSCIEFDIPFIYPNKMYSLVGTRQTMGTLSLQSFQTLRSATTAGTETVTISVVGSLHNVELVGQSMTAQSNTMAGAAKDLSRMGFHSASVWTNIMAKAAQIAGFSKNESEPGQKSVSMAVLHDMSNTDAPIPAASLALAGPGIYADRPAEDELLEISNFASRPAAFHFPSWTTTAAIEEQLFSMFVTPEVMVKTTTAGVSGANYSHVITTPAGYLSTMFKYWRGTVCYKIKAVCSKFHRGKVRIFYDSYSLAATPSEAALPSVIMDLATQTEVTLKIPMNAISPWLRFEGWLGGASPGTDIVYNYSSGGANPGSYDQSFYNGAIRGEVLQKLSAPTNSNIQFIITTWVEDMEVAAPRHMVNKSSVVSLVDAYRWQADSVVVPEEDIVADMLPVTRSDATHQVGEKVESLRAIMQRLCFHRILSIPSGDVGTYGANTMVLHQYWIPRVPRPFGSEMGATALTQLADICDRTSATVNNLFNYGNSIPFHYIAACFQGFKGDLRWAATALSGGLVEVGLNRGTLAPGKQIYGVTTANKSMTAYQHRLGWPDNCTGRSLMKTNYLATAVDLPDLTPVEFSPTNLWTPWSSSMNSMTVSRLNYEDTLVVQSTFNSIASDVIAGPASAVRLYAAAAPNVKFHHFKCIPILYYCWNSVAPVANSTL